MSKKKSKILKKKIMNFKEKNQKFQGKIKNFKERKSQKI